MNIKEIIKNVNERIQFISPVQAKDPIDNDSLNRDRESLSDESPVQNTH